MDSGISFKVRQMLRMMVRADFAVGRVKRLCFGFTER